MIMLVLVTTSMQGCDCLLKVVKFTNINPVLEGGSRAVKQPESTAVIGEN